MSNSNLSHAAIELKAQLHTADQLPKMHQDAILPELPDGDLWVFGYGSLLWRPGFEFIEKVDGRIYGYHRALCVSSWVHRGTPEHPGLVLGLDRGGSCTGKLFRVDEEIKQEVASYLYDRELPTMVYNARIIKIHRKGAPPIDALTFIVDPHHPQYSQVKAPQELAKIVSTAVGIYGNSKDYLLSTLEHLREDNIFDAHLEAVAAHL